MQYPYKFKEGDKVRLSGLEIEGYLVKIYWDTESGKFAHVICSVALTASEFKGSDICEAVEYIRTITRNIKTKLNCTTVTLDMENDMEIIG